MAVNADKRGIVEYSMGMPEVRDYCCVLVGIARPQSRNQTEALIRSLCRAASRSEDCDLKKSQAKTLKNKWTLDRGRSGRGKVGHFLGSTVSPR